MVKKSESESNTTPVNDSRTNNVNANTSNDTTCISDLNNSVVGTQSDISRRKRVINLNVPDRTQITFQKQAKETDLNSSKGAQPDDDIISLQASLLSFMVFKQNPVRMSQ